MKSSLVKLNHFIPLLTDVLPYEVPFFFSNKGIYESLKPDYDIFFNNNNIKKSKGEKNSEVDVGIYDFFIKRYFEKPELGQLRNAIQKIASEYVTIPYQYEIRKSEFDHRTISLIHPLAQIQACDFYKSHKDLILFCCHRSSFSLRYPDRLTTRLVTKHANLLNKIFKDEGEASTSDIKQKVIEDHQLITMSEVPNSYFVYEKYKKLHDFYDSVEYIELEKKYNSCVHFDVKRCFDSIYSHTITWAVKGKEYAKENKSSKQSGAFEDEFDRLMQFSNYGETNGIPIGAELSRIFSEVILQKIDLNIQRKLNETKINGEILRRGRDYDIKRYIDGYYVFTNGESIAKKIQKICEAELREYKLFVNESKTEHKSRPFTTNITSAKQKVQQLLKAHMDLYSDGSLPHNATPKQKAFSKYVHTRIAMNLIQDLRCIAHDYEITFYEIANICLGRIKYDLLASLSRLQDMESVEIKSKKSKIKAYLKNMLLVSFYVFYTSPRSHTCSTNFKINYVVLEILKIVSDEGFSGEIKQIIFSEYLRFFESISQQESIIEYLDIILIINELGGSFNLDENRLRQIFKVRNSFSTLSYFEIVVLLSYIKNHHEYDNIRRSIIDICIKKFENSGLKRSENFLLFFDMIKSPHLSNDEKKEIITSVGFDKNKTHIINFIESKCWFFDWDRQENLNLKNVLEIKEASNNY